MSRGAYNPDRGDIVWIDFSPQAGHEQAGRRPALVVSPLAYNKKVGLAILCPITSQVKGYPFEVALPDDLPIKGVVLSDQAKSLDWKARRTAYAGTVRPDITSEVLKRLGTLLQ